MKKLIHSISVLILSVAMFSFSVPPGKLVSKNTHVKFFSHTAVEDISANNYKVLSVIDQSTGSIFFSVPMQSFEFEKALMQEHFNGKDFLNTRDYPKAKFEGKITDLSSVRFTENGSYPVTVSGELTIKDVTRPVTEKGSIIVENGTIKAITKFNLILADYGVTFKKGKPSTNIAREIEVSVFAEYDGE
jgi:polyisoprenoid-binding protein YceI